MSTYSLGNRKVEVTETEFGYGEGAYVVSAYFTDNDQELTDEECETLTNIFQEELYQNAYERMASGAYDRAKDAWKYGDM